MAPKAITRDRVVHAASQSADKLRAEVRAALVEHLGCEYLDEANWALRRCGHMVVFANRPPIPELAHREIKKFHIDSYVPPALHFKEPVAPVEPLCTWT